MGDKPILFSAPMVRALLEGRKSQTRRILKPQPPDGLMPECMAIAGEAQPVGALWSRGDRLWVREAFAYGWPVEENQAFPVCDQEHAITFRADGNRPFGGICSGWKSPIHMPRWASRLTLVVCDVRVQRLQEISEADAKAEGVRPDRGGGGMAGMYGKIGLDPFAYSRGFASLWNSLHGPDAWAANQWICALTFTVHRCNIDKMEARHV